jgi:cytochrome c551/c552
MRIKSTRWLYPLLVPVFFLPSLAASGAAGDKGGAALYQDECASCHMAYPPELLPARSWQKILSRLDQHFGDNASLEPGALQSLQQYLKQNSADVVMTRRARRLLRSIPAQSTPVRISELAYIRRRHDEIPQRYITANPQVKSLSNCIACHQDAERGVFHEDSVRIPGYGRWDD